MADLDIRVWDVGHGLSAWIRTPNGQNHWVDAGFNPDPEFSPSQHVLKKYPNSTPINLLTISHPDKDHFDDLHNMIASLGKPLVLQRNKSLPDDIKFDSGQFAYQKAFRELDETYTHPIDWSISPMNPNCNGGVKVESGYLEWREVDDINNSSIVVLYQYANTLVIFPGDIEEIGWELLEPKVKAKFSALVDASTFRILVAPHHGRGSGYSQKMMDFFDPSLAIISDEHDRAPTDRRFQRNPSGIVIDGVETRYISTKSNSRVRLIIGPDGLSSVGAN